MVLAKRLSLAPVRCENGGYEGKSIAAPKDRGKLERLV